MPAVAPICAEQLMVYHFSGELRKPTIKIAATDRWSAIAHHSKLTGNSRLLPRAQVEFDPQMHMGKVEFAEVDAETLSDIPQFVPERSKKGDRTRYGNADPCVYPLLQHFGRASITPEWVIDKRTGKVEPSGEFKSMPTYFLDLSEKPSPSEVALAGGRINLGGGLDVQAMYLNDVYPWLRLDDGEDLRVRLVAEIERYEREVL